MHRGTGAERGCAVVMSRREGRTGHRQRDDLIEIRNLCGQTGQALASEKSVTQAGSRTYLISRSAFAITRHRETSSSIH